MTAECNHPNVEGGTIIEPREIVQAFGPNVTQQIPAYPGVALVNNEANTKVSLSRLECHHILMTSGYTVAKARNKAVADVIAGTPGISAQEALGLLLYKAYQGEQVNAREVAEAQAAILLEEKAEQGRSRRAEVAEREALRERRKATAEPVRQELEESRENLQNAQDEAFRAVMALLDAVDQDHRVHDEAVDQLLGAGYEQDEVRPPARGYLHETVADGQGFPFWPKMEHLVAVLNAVKQSRHSNAFFSMEGRDLGKHLPIPIPQGPAVSSGADEG